MRTGAASEVVAMTSPLGSADDLARVRAVSPEICSVVDDLETVIGPEFAAADETAVAARRVLSRARVLDLVGGGMVSVLGLVRLGLGEDARWASVAAAVVAAAVSLSTFTARNTQMIRWLDHRRLAEELRSLYFRHLVGSLDVPSDERRRTIAIEVVRLVGTDRLHDVATTPRPDAVPLRGEAWAIYAERRLREQIEWMTGRVRTMESRTRVLSSMQTGLMAVAALCGAASAIVDDPLGQALAIPVAAMAGLVATLASIDSVVANERLAAHYQQSIRRLNTIERALGSSTGTLQDVAEIESVLMSEHRAWHRLAQEGAG